jgi:transcription elongation factor Elf1
MPSSKHFLSSVFLLTLSVFLFNSCFPTKSDESAEEQQPTDPLVEDVDPNDLPEDIDPNLVVNEGSIDSLFDLLTKRVESLEDAETPDDVFNTDFISIRNGFATAVSRQPENAKANVGFIVSSICAVNTSANIKKAIDSIQAYIEAVDNYYDSYNDEWILYKKRSNANAKRKLPGNNQQIPLKKAEIKKPLISNVFNRKGIEGVGVVLLAESPKIIAAQSEKPSFPSFLTVSFIQKTVEEDIIPRLNDVISACNRLTQNEMSLVMTAFGETFELDKGDILLFEAGIRLVRAGLGLFTTYNMDIQTTDGSSIINLLDDVDDEDADKYIYRLQNDTLICLWVFNEEKYTSKITDVVQHNLKRPDFLKIRRANHEWVYNDLKMVPQLIKASIQSMKAETDQQDDDLIPAGEIFNLDADMADISMEMVEEGLSPSLAAKFSSPEALMDFVIELLTKEYTFSETIDGYDITMTVDLSKWFTNPVSDLKTLFPKYRLSQAHDRLISYSDKSYGNGGVNYFWADPEDIIDIPESMIASKYLTSGQYYVTLKENFSVILWIDSAITCVPFYLIDDSGKDLPIWNINYDMDYIQILRECFPYFNDYTFNGFFPRMTTRNSWIDFLSQFYE